MKSSPSLWLYEARDDLRRLGEPLIRLRPASNFRIEIRPGKKSLWTIVESRAGGSIVFRLAHALGGQLRLTNVLPGKTPSFELRTDFGSLRVSIGLQSRRRPLLHWTTSFLPKENLQLPFWPRDVYVCGPDLDPLQSSGLIHTAQRGLRTGILFASATSPSNFTFLYLQNFSELGQFYEATQTSPADRVGGLWPELGYSIPPSKVALPKSREVTISDVYVALTHESCEDERRTAVLYFDLLAKVYQMMPHPATTYHDWPTKAKETLRHLSFSPNCSYTRQGRRYALPYVGDETKPPESMVQFTVLLPAHEYGAWACQHTPFVKELIDSTHSFYDHKVGAVVRWLPGERFKNTSESNQNQSTMDSWYLYHTLFNLSRLAKLGNAKAKQLFRASLPLAMRVAKRFDYRWPVFFDIRSLDVVRAETAPGQGGENDVAGLYALVMLQAHEMNGQRKFLAEAHQAAGTLSGLGFTLGYQMNTTGFAAEAMLRLWKLSGKQIYLDELSLPCQYDRQYVDVGLQIWLGKRIPNVLRALPIARGALSGRV